MWKLYKNLVKDYMHHRTMSMIMGTKFKMIPELEELVVERYTSTGQASLSGSIKSLRHRYNYTTIAAGRL